MAIVFFLLLYMIFFMIIIFFFRPEKDRLIFTYYTYLKKFKEDSKNKGDFSKGEK